MQVTCSGACHERMSAATTVTRSSHLGEHANEAEPLNNKFPQCHGRRVWRVSSSALVCLTEQARIVCAAEGLP